MTTNDEQLLTQASTAYYEGDPIISDEQFDALEQKVISETGSTEPLVGGGYIPDSRKVDHVSPMMSLAKVHSREDVIGWLRKTTTALGTDKVDLVVEPKWDGLAIEVVVDDGVITVAATRGDGVTGEDVTETARRIPDIASAVSDLDRTGRHVLYFEVVMHKHVLHQINSQYELDFKNTRNAVAGIIRREDDLGRELAGHLNAANHAGTEEGTHHASLYKETEVIEFLNLIEGGRADFSCEIDGVVIKLADTDAQEQLGFTSHSPRWAVAYKFPAESTTTTLRSVSWRKGRTGRITPVATFDPVLLAGATIVNATLHNLDFVNNLELRIGDIIVVKRAGDVIPYIEGVERHDPEGELVVCPDDVESESVILDQIHHALVSLGADGIGYSSVHFLYEQGVITGDTVPKAIDSLLSLREGSISHLDGWGEQSEARFLYAIDSVRPCYARAWVASLGVPAVGRTVSSALEKRYDTLQGIAVAQYDELIELDGFGPSRAKAVIDALPLLSELISVLDKHGITPPVEEKSVVNQDSEWAGRNVVITGTFEMEGYTRSQISAALTALGANIQGSVSKKTDVLIAGDRAGSKLAKAESLGVTILTSEDVDLDALIG